MKLVRQLVIHLALLCLSVLLLPCAVAQQGPALWTGTAFAITDDGYLGTNAHVVDNAISINVYKDGVKRSARVVAIDLLNDVAILKVDTKSAPLYLDGAHLVRKGADVSTLGFPNIGIQGNESKYTSGLINSESGLMNDGRYFQISVPVQPGNSGGPLLDADGSVVGIVTAKLKTSQAMIASGEVPQNVNYALKVKYLLTMIAGLHEVSAHILKAPLKPAKNNEDVAAMADSAVYLVFASKPNNNVVVATESVQAQTPAPIQVQVPPSSGEHVSAPANARVVKIGQVSPLSGMLAHLGQDNENGARLAIEEANAANLSIGGEHVWFELVSRDDGADPKKGVAVARELVAAGVVGVIGHLNSGTTIPAAPIYADAGIVQITPSATNPKYTMLGYHTAFRLTTNDKALAEVLSDYTYRTVQPARVVVVDDATAYGQGVVAAFSSRLNKQGVNIAGQYHVSTRQTDFHDLATEIQGLHPDLVFFGGMDSTAGPLLRAVHDTGLDPFFVGSDGICTAQMATFADRVDKVICAQPDGTRANFVTSLESFKSRYRHRFSSEMQVFGAKSYDATKLMIAAMMQANSTDPHVYVNTLRAIEYQGVDGLYQFDQNGDLQSPTITVYQYSGKTRVLKEVFPH